MNKKYWKTFLATALILAFVLLPHSEALAYVPFASDLMNGVLNWLNSTILFAMGEVIAWAAWGLEYFVNPQTQQAAINTLVVRTSWQIVRDFVNMFFILALIIMAFGTIFDSSKYSYRNMLAPLIVAALLINFSLVIGQYVIGLGNGLASVFLKEISGFSKDFAEGFKLGKLIPDPNNAAVAAFAQTLNSGAKLAVNFLFALVFMIIVLFAFLAAFIFALIRIPILWLILIFSPIAWAGYIFPNLRSLWSKWWNYLVSWSFFLPVYLFFLMFAVIFIRRKNEMISAMPASGGFVATFTGPGGVFSDLIFYFFTVFLLVGGLKASFSVGNYAANGAGKLMSWAENSVRRYAPGAAYVRGAKEGLKERAEEVKEKGVFGIGGAQRARIQEARARGWLAPAPTTGELERRRAEAAEVDRATKKLQSLNLNLDELNKRLTSGNRFEQIAAFKIKAESGWLKPTDLSDVNRRIREAGGGRTALGASIISSLKRGRFAEMAVSPVDKERIFAGLEDREAKKAFALDMAESSQVMNEDLAKTILDLHQGESKEVIEKVRSALKKNVDNWAIGKTSAEKDALLNKLGTVDEELQKVFALDMAKSKDVIDDTLMVKILDIYKDESTEARKIMDEALKENIQNFAKNKTERADLFRNTATDRRIKRLAAQVLVDKNEIDTWTLKREVLDIYGGVDPATGTALTAEGRNVTKMIDDNNSGIKEEGAYRKGKGISHATDLNLTERSELEDRVINSIKSGFIGGFTTEELLSPVISNALHRGRTGGRLTAEEFYRALGIRKIDPTTGRIVYGKGKPDRKKRETINNLITSGPVPYS